MDGCCNKKDHLEGNIFSQSCPESPVSVLARDKSHHGQTGSGCACEREKSLGLLDQSGLESLSSRQPLKPTFLVLQCWHRVICRSEQLISPTLPFQG